MFSDFGERTGRVFFAIKLIKAVTDLLSEMLEFDFQKRHVVLLRGDDEGWATVFGDGNRTRAGGVQNVAELLFGIVGGEGDHGIPFRLFWMKWMNLQCGI